MLDPLDQCPLEQVVDTLHEKRISVSIGRLRTGTEAASSETLGDKSGRIVNYVGIGNSTFSQAGLHSLEYGYMLRTYFSFYQVFYMEYVELSPWYLLKL